MNAVNWMSLAFCALMIGTCLARNVGANTRIEQNKQIVIRFYNALVQGDVDTLKAFSEHWDYQEVFPRGADKPKNDSGRF